MRMNSNPADNAIGRTSEREIFLGAADIDEPSEREKFLHAACGNDTDLRARVARLLSVRTEEQFLERRSIGRILPSKDSR